MLNNPAVVVSIIVGTFLIVACCIVGLVVLAVTYPSVVTLVIPILASVLTGLITGVTAVFTHFLGGVQEQQRLILARGINETQTSTGP